MPRVLEGSKGGERFLAGEVALYAGRVDASDGGAPVDMYIIPQVAGRSYLIPRRS